MATGPITQVSDVVVPEIFTPYVQQITEEKSRLIQSGAGVRDQQLDNLLAGGGLTFNTPSFQDLDNDDDRISSDTPYSGYTGGDADPDPRKINTSTEVAVRLSRNNSWSSADLASTLAGADPMASIANRVGYYWTRRLQAAFVATVNGVFANNVANEDDMSVDISSTAFEDGVTTFSAEAFIDAATTMGDSMEDLTMVMMHSVVYAKAQKNNLIDFIPDARGEIVIPTFLGRQVIVDDGMPVNAGVYDTWIFGAGSIRIGASTPKVPTEIERHPGAGNGGGQEVLWNRNEWTIHPVGYAYAGTAPPGGPNNNGTTNNLAAATSWTRAYPERKQIKIARLVTREA